MSKKEQIFEEYKKVRAEYYDLIGKADNSFYDSKVYNCNTMQDLIVDVKTYKQKIEAIKKRKQVEEWNQTEEGKAFYNDIEAKIKEVNDKRKELVWSATDYLRGLIHKELGENWDVDFGETFSNIGIVESYYPNSKPKFIFGHYFELHYDYFFESIADEKPTFKLKFNYGSLGEFEVTESSTIIMLLKGMSKFLSTNITEPLTKRLKEFIDAMNKEQKEIYRLRKLKENPPIKEIA